MAQKLTKWELLRIAAERNRERTPYNYMEEFQEKSKVDGPHNADLSKLQNK